MSRRAPRVLPSLTFRRHPAATGRDVWHVWDATGRIVAAVAGETVEHGTGREYRVLYRRHGREWTALTNGRRFATAELAAWSEVKP